MEKCGVFLRRVDDPRRKKIKLAFANAAKLAQEKEGATLFECLDGDGDYVPYTDCDHYCDGPDRPSDEFIESLRLEMFHNLNLLVGPQGYEGCELKMATRHGLVADKGLYKLSFRCYLLGFKIQPRTLGDFIRRRGLGDKKFGHFDTAPYGKTQLLGCVGFSKSEKDRRVLQPHDDDPLEKYMVQNLTGEETVLEFPEDTGYAGPLDASQDSSDFNGQRFAPPWALLEQLVMSLSVAKRCALDTYKEWTEVGWALAGVARVCKRFSDGFDLWIRFCQLDMSAYLDGPTKAFDVYQYAATSGPQLGWRSLMQWLKEDDPQTHRHILSELQKVDAEEVTSAEDIKIIKEFVMSSFRHSGGLIAGVTVRTYDDCRYIIVELNSRSSCNFINDDHDNGTLNRIVIGLKTARDSARIPCARASLTLLWKPRTTRRESRRLWHGT